MYKKLSIGMMTLLALLSSCSGVTPHISAICEENKVGNCIVKWETAPLIEGEVKVYASTDPDHIPEKNAVASANIANQWVTVINADPTQRRYYTLLFDERHRKQVASRNVNLPGIQNFRDLGGYPSGGSGKEVRWGKLYRSGEAERLNPFTLKKLKNMGVKTVIDLRSPSEKIGKPSLSKDFKVVDIPLISGNTGEILKDIMYGRIKSDTVYRLVERMNRELMLNSTDEFRRVFDVLLDEDNYPVVIQCTSGKGRTGIVSALILAAIDVNEDLIMYDYRLSNHYFNIRRAWRDAYSLPPRRQEAVTTLFSARENFLNAAKDEVESKYGSVEDYLKEGIGLDKSELKKLKRLLLH